MSFTITYILAEHGWADAKIEKNGFTYEIDSISFLSDAYNSLSVAILDILNGESESVCAFDHEPGRTKLRFMRQDGEIVIAVYEFDNELMDEPWEKGDEVAKLTVSRNRLKSEYLRISDLMLEEIGEEQYKARWKYAFPREVYDEIRRS